MTSDAASVLRELAPAGKLRAGINYSNFVLAKKDPASGEPRGVAVELRGPIVGGVVERHPPGREGRTAVQSELL